ncbi:MAG: phosphoribosylamine--glycine ligase [Calditrichota bacterium]
MKIAVIGSGGREHAILWRLSRDNDRRELYALPGNGGTHKLATSVSVNTADTRQLIITVRNLSPDLVVVGPENPLADGIVDHLQEFRIPCFGPMKAAARLESSKAFAKQFMQECDIPTADFEIFTDFENLRKFMDGRDQQEKWVVKADGLAAGKGAFVCSSHEEVLRYSHALLIDGLLGSAGKTIVLEKRLEGREVSALFWCDGERFLPFPPAQDYKRALDNDQGANTGGMGSYCPAPHLTAELQDDVSQRIVAPLVRRLAELGTPYTGVLYVGLMLTASGPQVIEFNCRFGDPETQVILPVWGGNFAETMLACSEGGLSQVQSTVPPLTTAAVCVVLAAEGYPDPYKKEIPLHDIADTEHSVTYHAGTIRDGARLLSSGGRVLNAVGFGSDLSQARSRAYERAEQLKVAGLRYRSDIAVKT